MVAHQREMGAAGGIVMEGRDIGTKVFPDADLKIFLDADPVVREQRRMVQQKIKGELAASVAAELRERDHRDRTRATSPLVAAEDAVVIDSSSMSEDEVLARVEELATQRLESRRLSALTLTARRCSGALCWARKWAHFGLSYLLRDPKITLHLHFQPEIRRHFKCGR